MIKQQHKTSEKILLYIFTVLMLLFFLGEMAEQIGKACQ